MNTQRRNRMSGFSLVEAAMGVGLLSAAGVVICGLLTAGIKTYRDSMIQMSALMSARELFEGQAAEDGVLSAAMLSRSFLAVAPTEFSLLPPAGASLRFHLSGTELLRSQLGQSARRGKDVKALEFRYYAIGADGRIAETLDPASAEMTVVYATFPGRKGKDVRVLAGASSRNRG